MDTRSIEKEDVASCHFPHEEVLSNPDDRKLRAANIKKAEALGNIEHHKISIIFEDNECVKRVVTTIWAADDNNIVLKQGVFIPVHRIHKVALL